MLDPFSSFLTLRGIRTLALRMERHSANALQLAEWLEQQPEVERVWFPWLASHPHHQLARQQMALPGGMISVVVKGDEGYAERIISKLRWFTLAEMQNAVGGVLDPFSSFLTLRGIRTLALRMERHSANALQLAEWLEQQPEVERVWFPWLASHPHHQLARQQMALPGGMISVVVKGDEGYAERIISKLRWFTLAEMQNAVGGVLDPFSSFLTLRGIRTLALRMERHSANALQLAEWLEQQPEVERVWFPWLASHPHHQLARQQMALPGGMISVVVKGDEGYAERIISKLRWFTLAESLGGVESLVSQPFSMTHASIPLEKRLANGITPQLIRLSVGIEDPHDLIADWQQALRRE
ncbi:PLP-dependent transferase [Klebsiella pneumoniae]|uniref:PLP-dependent transferase n=2 Tax=Klebsiella pneumoniae TaxID=573 RepID=UPI0029CAB62F|nr:PLP-dependent transferase [Klebsiella pneumoniae]